MDAAFWQARWDTGQIGFHEGRPNRYLTEFVDTLGEGRRVLVPLCGKTVDLAYLAERGHQVVGVELVEAAVVGFFAERELTPTIEDRGQARRYTSGAIELWVADMLTIEPDALGPVDALYDRAALIALPPALRHAYAERLRALLPAGAPALVVTMTYPQTAMPGPPFAVEDDELDRLFAGLPRTRLADADLAQPRLAALGLTGRERCDALTF